MDQHLDDCTQPSSARRFAPSALFNAQLLFKRVRQHRPCIPTPEYVVRWILPVWSAPALAAGFAPLFRVFASTGAGVLAVAALQLRCWGFCSFAAAGSQR